MKSSNLALRHEEIEEPAPGHPPENSARARIEARAAARRARQRASFEHRAIVIRDQGLRPLRVR
jgi:hypothetical protein